MTVNEMMSELKSLGSEQTCKTYKRHGVKGDMFGVSYANLGKIKKKIKVDHKLAEQLWATGNHDARIVATMIADPKQVNDKTARSLGERPGRLRPQQTLSLNSSAQLRSPARRWRSGRNQSRNGSAQQAGS